LLHPEIANKINLKEYVDFRYQESLAEVEILSTDSKETAEKRKISHLTLNWFMQTLLDRSDRMAMYNGFELRVPFCDYRLAQYVWNIPWEIKALNGREKGLLRYVARDFLPAEIVDRKKSPYPKTHNPTYLAKVKTMLTKIMEDKNAPINHLLNREFILDILNTDCKAFTRPWFRSINDPVHNLWLIFVRLICGSKNISLGLNYSYKLEVANCDFKLNLLLFQAILLIFSI